MGTLWQTRQGENVQDFVTDATNRRSEGCALHGRSYLSPSSSKVSNYPHRLPQREPQRPNAWGGAPVEGVNEDSLFPWRLRPSGKEKMTGQPNHVQVHTNPSAHGSEQHGQRDWNPSVLPREQGGGRRFRGQVSAAAAGQQGTGHLSVTLQGWSSSPPIRAHG